MEEKLLEDDIIKIFNSLSKSPEKIKHWFKILFIDNGYLHSKVGIFHYNNK